MHDTFTSPLAERYASRGMLELWSPRARYSLWRRLWIALAEAQQELGVAIPPEALAQMRAYADDIDFDAVHAYERRFRHDVMAHVHAFGDVAPLARAYVHLGATSAYVTDNADLILMRRALELLDAQLVALIRALADFASRWRAEPTLGYTHLQPAQLTTVGKRATLWIQDFVLDLADLRLRRENMPFRGVKGTTGTQASFLDLFAGDHEKVKQLDEMVTARMGFASSIAVSGQTYTRKLDSRILSVLAGVAASGGKFSSDVRVLQAFGELEEPFEQEQIGSSAMAYKRNPMRSERIAGLARFVISLEPNANQTHSVQYLERTLDDSANRRIVIPEMFLAADAILRLCASIASGLVLNQRTVERRVRNELPFLATERLIVRAVQAGADRQDAHELVRRHSMAVREASAGLHAVPGLLERLGNDPEFPLSMDEVNAVATPADLVGRAPEQVDEFLADVVEPLLGGEVAAQMPGDDIQV